MATPRPTQKPVPSNDIRDLPFNSEKMDEFTNSESYTYVDRLGKNRRTLAGIDNDANRAMSSYGYITKDSFETGNTLFDPNNVLRWRFNGEYYRWDGDWSGPKVVPAGSTPMSTGGQITPEKPTGQWTAVGDAALRGDMGSLSSPSLIGLSNYNDIRNYNGASNRLAAIHPSSTNIDCTYATFNLNAAVIAEDDGAVVLVDKLGRRWVRQFTGNPDVRWWGAKEGGTDSAKAFNDAAKYSWYTGATIEVNGEYTCKSPIMAGVVGNDSRYANVSFSGSGSSYESTGSRGIIYFDNCDGFKVVRRNTLSLKYIYAKGVKDPESIPDTIAALLALKNSAVSAYYDTMEVNCIIDVSYCRFSGWKIGTDQSKGAWSSTVYNNEIYRCYQAGIFFKPNNSQIEKNKVAYCARGMLLIKPLSGRFSLNELNSSDATEYLIYLQEPAAYSISDNYIEPWTTGLNKNCNWGFGYIPIIIELNQYQPSMPVISGCEIYTTNADAAILYTVPEAYKDINYLTYAQPPSGNTLKAKKGVLVAARGAGNLSFRQPGWSGTEKTAINGATGAIHFTALGYSTHASITPDPTTIAALMSSGERLKIQENVNLDRTGGSVDATSFVNTYRSRQQFAVSLQITAGSTAVNMFFDAFRNSNVQNRLPVTVPANEIRYLTFIITPPQDGSLVNYSFSLGVRGGVVAAPASMVIDITRTFV